MTKTLRTLLTIAALALAAPAYADVVLTPILSSNAVLQRELPIPVWGWDKPGQEVSVTLDGQTKTAKADDKGFWIVKLDPKKAGGPYDMTVKGSTTVESQNLLIGEVWFCSGQSNMEWPLKNTTNAQEEAKTADRPTLRTINIPNTKTNNPRTNEWISTKPELNPTFKWEVCTPQSAPGFSGVAYYFGKELNSELNVPIGLINSSWGGTYIEAWISKAGLESVPSLKPIFDRHQASRDAYPTALANYEKAVQKIKDDAALKASTQPASTQPAAPLKFPPKPAEPTGPNAPTVLYNGMVFPVINFPIRGAIWYQGEANAQRFAEYQTLLPTLIKDWRAAWGLGDFPFLVVQLPNYNAPTWAYMREAQANGVQSVPNADYAVTIDVGTNGDIHPKNKKDPGFRLARIALKNVYGKKDIVDRGPTYAGLKIQGAQAIVSFDNVGGGLVTKDGKAPTYFEIAGDDSNFVPAEAVIKNSTIILTSPKVPAPVYARFAWSAAINGFNLYNKEGFPAAPFRSENRPPKPSTAK